MFICDILDATPKDDMASMEHPFFSLSKKPDHRIKKYEHNGEYIEIAPSAYGVATIKDKDILILPLASSWQKLTKAKSQARLSSFQPMTCLYQQTEQQTETNTNA